MNRALNFNIFSVREQNLSEIVGLDGWEFTDPPKYINTYGFEELDTHFWIKFCQETWAFPFYVGVVYLSVIFSLQKFMKNRPPLKLKWTLMIWNLGLGLFSMMGFARMLPAFLDLIFRQEDGFFKSICVRVGADFPTTFWYLAFGVSKFIELGDTVFLVLRKRPLVVLQYYHHLITMISGWLLGPLVEPVSRWYVVMNYGIHSIMYPYFSARAIGIHIPTKIARSITTLQLLQMLLGLFFNFYTIFLINNGIECSRHPFSIKFFGFIYGSFTILFGKLFYDNVIAPSRKTHKKED